MLQRIKILLNITGEDLDVTIQSYITNVTNRLLVKYNWTVVPEEYQYLIQNYVIAIFRAKRTLGIADDDLTKDTQLFDSFAAVENDFLEFMNLRFMPDALIPEIVDGIVFAYTSAAGGGSSGSVTGPVESVKEGDTQVKFASQVRSKDERRVLIQDVLRDGISNLEKYRRFNY